MTYLGLEYRDGTAKRTTQGEEIWQADWEVPFGNFLKMTKMSFSYFVGGLPCFFFFEPFFDF